MPRRDGTGPNGQGPMTGRGCGNCRGERKERFCGTRNGFGRNVRARCRGFFRRLFARQNHQ
ncbi:MAG: DUF5320 domain-containing protein [Pseudomonadota bacterium]|nr:DUF5320 domain-containing protein [Gammaproteobacteria bacterium]MBU1558976.1 DUF5320 domain-containing protein [Gammaproteobacteria bacterium]MBU1628540.1 DUF5320 domain-containing protein [Gammaproteobacteria bacterium]MBU1926789.1 DUF5320 domain-containing protein [Gammaproteobacteria bacterium]MBU2546353.1 DUF5320 domain-containing protein [Gammaproteobacteria bacterium]